MPASTPHLSVRGLPNRPILKPVLRAALLLLACASPLARAAAVLSGTLTDPQGRAVAAAQMHLERSGVPLLQCTTDSSGQFAFAAIDPGPYQLTAQAPGFAPVTRAVVLPALGGLTLNLQFTALAGQNDSVTVTADLAGLGLFLPDPAQRILIRDETLDANPGRPGMPVSIPGMPVESPAGGVKPPQYFVPGVAGDHGEPIAMFFQVGSFLFPNNLPANAHGNGYADPNVLIPIAIENIQTDGGAFNVREGNNSENASIVFGLRSRIQPQARLTADQRDLNLVAAWSPANPAQKVWAGIEFSYGNGYLKRLEHRRQFKANLSRVFDFGAHELTVYGIGYNGFAYQPGLIPIAVPVAGDTIDPRQREDTSNGALILNDVWRTSSRAQFQFSAFYRYYTLDVRPNFGYIPSTPDCGAAVPMPSCGNGLIRQSERRNVNAEDAAYAHTFNPRLALMAGVDLRREAPSALDLDRAGDSGLFYPVTGNNVVIDFTSAYAAADGALTRWMHYDAGYRRDQVTLRNQDLYRPASSFTRDAGVGSPKGTLTVLPPPRLRSLPTLAYSYGQSFHVNDPRIGSTAIQGGTIVSLARSHQLVLSATAAGAAFRLTLQHVTTAQQLARLSNDTGLQEDVGPGLLRSLTATARRNFRGGSLQALFARADARDRLTGQPTPEAPRLIWDLLAAFDKLPAHLSARAEFEQVGRKPLGDGFVAVPVRELRAAVVRPFSRSGIELGINIFAAGGYGGQTLESLALPGDSAPFERITGFPLKSYVAVSITRRFGQR